MRMAAARRRTGGRVDENGRAEDDVAQVDELDEFIET